MTIEITPATNGRPLIATNIMPHATRVGIQFSIYGGSRHEPWNANGLMHFIEHILFKRNKVRTSYGTYAAIENRGGSINAHTEREEMGYEVRTRPKHEAVENAIMVLADMLLRPKFLLEDIEREEGVVIEEIRQYVDQPKDLALDMMMAAAYPRQKLGRPILGTEKSITEIQRSTIIGQVMRSHTIKNIAITVTGNLEAADLDHNKIVRMVTKQFSGVPLGERPKVGKAIFSSGSVTVNKSLEQNHVVIGFPAPGRYHKSCNATQVLCAVMEHGFTSILSQVMREKEGIVYDTSATYEPFLDSGLFYIHAGIDRERFDKGIGAISKAISKEAKTITLRQLNRAKEQFCGHIEEDQNDPMEQLDVLGPQLLFLGYAKTTEQILERVKSVSLDEARAVADTIFSQKPIIASVGPSANSPGHKKILAKLVS